MRPELLEFLGGMIGETAWAASRGFGSFMTVNFGPPDPTHNTFGLWHLWVQGAYWEIIANHTEVLVDQSDQDETQDQVLSKLNGRRFITIHLTATWTRFLLSEGFEILLRKPLKATDLPLWVLYLPGNEVLVQNPDCSITHKDHDLVETRLIWQP